MTCSKQVSPRRAFRRRTTPLEQSGLIRKLPLSFAAAQSGYLPGGRTSRPVPVRVKLPVAVGDSVTVSIFQMSPGWWALAVHDVTAKRSFLLAQPYAGPQASVEWVVEAPQVFGVLRNPVPFSTVNFRHLGAEGQARDLEGFSFRSGGHVASPSEVIGSSGQLIRGFTVHWASA